MYCAKKSILENECGGTQIIWFAYLGIQMDVISKNYRFIKSITPCLYIQGVGVVLLTAFAYHFVPLAQKL